MATPVSDRYMAALQQIRIGLDKRHLAVHHTPHLAQVFRYHIPVPGTGKLVQSSHLAAHTLRDNCYHRERHIVLPAVKYRHRRQLVRIRNSNSCNLFHYPVPILLRPAYPVYLCMPNQAPGRKSNNLPDNNTGFVLLECNTRSLSPVTVYKYYYGINIYHELRTDRQLNNRRSYTGQPNNKLRQNIFPADT